MTCNVFQEMLGYLGPQTYTVSYNKAGRLKGGKNKTNWSRLIWWTHYQKTLGNVPSTQHLYKIKKLRQTQAKPYNSMWETGTKLSEELKAQTEDTELSQGLISHCRRLPAILQAEKEGAGHLSPVAGPSQRRGMITAGDTPEANWEIRPSSCRSVLPGGCTCLEATWWGSPENAVRVRSALGQRNTAHSGKTKK